MSSLPLQELLPEEDKVEKKKEDPYVKAITQWEEVLSEVRKAVILNEMNTLGAASTSSSNEQGAFTD